MKIITVTKLHKQRIQLAVLAIIVCTVVTSLVLFALKNNINLFYTPSEIHASVGKKQQVRLGGMVAKNSVDYKEGVLVNFILTDFKTEITVEYSGVLPDLFKEGQGVVTQGRLGDNGIFQAKIVLAKHDEKYMPPNASYQLNSKD